MNSVLSGQELPLGRLHLPLGTSLATLDIRDAETAAGTDGAAYAASLYAAVHRHGALLLQSSLRSADDLSVFLKRVGYRPFSSYVGGTAIRSAPVADNVSRSTDLPPDVTIPLHQEMAYVATIPDYICLFCAQEATGDQKTNLVGDMARFTRELPDWVFQKYRGRTARLRRVMPPRGTNTGIFRLRRCWNDMLGTSDKAEAEQVARARHWQLRWMADDFVEVLQEPFPFFRTHFQQGEVWCTQAFAYLPVVQSYLAQKDGRADDWSRLQSALAEAPAMLDGAVLDDGTPLSDEDALFMHQRLERQTESLSLRAGEMLLLDNILFAHGRSPFHGTRTIYVSLGERH